MNDLGFNADAPDSVKEAFLKYLIKQGAGACDTPHKVIQFPVQLSFDLSESDQQKKVKS